MAFKISKELNNIIVINQSILASMKAQQARTYKELDRLQNKVRSEADLPSNRFLDWSKIVDSYIASVINSRVIDYELLKRYEAYVKDLVRYNNEYQISQMELDNMQVNFDNILGVLLKMEDKLLFMQHDLDDANRGLPVSNRKTPLVVSDDDNGRVSYRHNYADDEVEEEVEEDDDEVEEDDDEELIDDETEKDIDEDEEFLNMKEEPSHPNDQYLADVLAKEQRENELAVRIIGRDIIPRKKFSIMFKKKTKCTFKQCSRALKRMQVDKIINISKTPPLMVQLRPDVLGTYRELFEKADIKNRYEELFGDEKEEVT